MQDMCSRECEKTGSDGKGLLETGRSDFEIYGTGERVRGDLISYADSSGGVNILGPKMMEAVTVNFTYPFLKKIEQLADDKTMILLCPKTTLALIGTEKAKFVDHQLEEPIGYAQACIHMIGKAHFAGQMCIKNVGYQLNHGIFKEVKLL